MFAPRVRLVFVSVFLVIAVNGVVPSPQPPPLSANVHEGGAGASSLLPSACRSTVNGSVEIRLPFMDMELGHEHPLYLLRESIEDVLLVLHGYELFQLHVASGANKRLVRLGELSGRVRALPATSLGAEVVVWRQFLLLAIVLPETLEVYQLPKEQLMADGTQLSFEPIQEFALAHGFQQMHLLRHSAPEKVLLLLASNYTKSQGRIQTFEWLDTYFNPVEDLFLPAIRTLQLVGLQPLYIITGRSLRGSQSKLVLTVFELDPATMRLRTRQTLTTQARHVLAFRFRDRNCFIACSSTSSSGSNVTASASTSPACLFFRMVEGQFVVNRKHVQRDLQFSRVTVAQQGRLLIGARSNGEVLVFNTLRLDCYNGFVVRGDVEPSGLLSHRNAQNESFLLLAYRRSSSDLVRMVQLGGEPQQQQQERQETSNQVGREDLSVVQLHRHEFEDTLSSLRGLLLRLKESIAELSRWQKLLQHHSSIQLQKPFHLAAKGRIQRLQLQGSHLLTPTQLQQRLEQLRERFVVTPIRQSRSRLPRSFGAGNGSDVIELLKVKKRLHVKNLIYQGQLLSGHTLDASLLTLKTPLRTKTLHTEQLLTPQDYQNIQKTVAPSSGSPKANLWVRHLHVDRINGVSWFEFYDSLFLRSRDEQLEGRLIFQSHSRVVNLQTTLLNGLVVAQLFNLRRHQVISSNLFMSAFYVSRLEAGRVNGLDFARDIVFRGGNSTWIKTPVRIFQMSVSGDILVGNQTASREGMQPRQMQTSENQRLQQYYTGKVTIQGSLTLNNVKRDTQKTRLLLATGQSLAKKDLHSNYLLAHAAQNLSQLMFGNAKVTTPSLVTNHIQGHPVEEHLLARVSQVASNRTLHIIFMNVSIEGNILCRDYTSSLALISREAVRHGQLANITGHKHFSKPLTVQTLLSQQLNGVPVAELVLKSDSVQNFTGAKKFQRLVIGKDMEIRSNLNLSRLNGLPLSQLLGHALSLQRLELAGPVQLQSLHFRRLNGLAFDELLGKLSTGPKDGNAPQLLLRKQLLIEGNVRFERGLRLQELNGIQWEEYLARLARPDANAVLAGRKTFLAPVQLTDALQSPHINGLDLSSLLDNTLLRTTPQAITGAYSFRRMSASNVDVPRLNGVPAQLFLDTRQEQLLLRGDLTVAQLSVNGSLKCPQDLGLGELENRLTALWKQPWRRVVVTGDALWQAEDEAAHESHLNYLREHAVRREGNQTIAGHVLLRQPRLESLHTRQQQPLLANLNFTHLAADALLRWTASNESQLVEAPQKLLGPVWAKCLDLAADGHFGRLNDIDLERLNASLYRQSNGGAIRAELRFETPPRLGRLTLGQPGLVNGAPIEGIFVQGEGRPWPRASFRELRVEQDLRLGSVNEMSLDYFFEHRVPLRGPTMEVFGSLSFERMILEGRPLLRSINGIGLEDVVYRHSPRLQSFVGSMTFAGGVEFVGPGHVMYLNGRDLSESYRQSIFKDRDYNIDSLWLDEARFPAGLVYVDPAPANYLLREAASERDPEALEALENLLQEATGKKASKRRLLYLDYDQKPFKALWSEASAAAPPTNESFDLQSRLSLGQQSSDICQGRQLRAELQLQPAMVYLTNVSLSSELLRLDSGDKVRVKVQNHCQRPVKRLRSTIRIECRNESFTLGMRQPVEHLEMLDEALILLGSAIEVRILRLSTSNCSLTDWQSLESMDGRLMKIIHMGKTPQRQQLLLSSGVHNHRPAISIHLRDASSERFLLAQLIGGDYDQAEFQEDQLMLSCRGCRHIAIYMLNHTHEEGPRFVPLQQLRLREPIQQMIPLRVGGERYLLVLTQPEAKPFYLFSYGEVGGWLQHSYGHKGDGQQWALPLVQSGEELQQKEAPLMLLCGGGVAEGAGEGECTLVRALLD